jgi:hypothetical protein
MAQSDSEFPTQASKAVKELAEGHVINVPQYETSLEVIKTSALNGEENAFIGLEFTENQTSADKTLIVNRNSGRVYLTTGTADKGEVTEIDIVASPEADESDDRAAQTAAELESREGVRRATPEWEDCDVAVVTEHWMDLGPLRDEFDVTDANHFDAAPYILVKIDLDTPEPLAA